MLGDAKVWEMQHSIVFGGAYNGKSEKSKKNNLVFAQMEGQPNQKIEENGPPEAETCCRGRKYALAALGNAGCCFSVAGRVLRSDMGPELALEDRFWTFVFRR